MEYILNEQSLKGQFANSDNFATDGMKPLLGVIKTLSSIGVNDILKNQNFFNSEVVPGKKWYELKHGRMSDTVRAMCSLLSKMQGQPYWDLTPRQDMNKHYYIQRAGDDDAIVEIDVAQTGVAEAFARKGCLISFTGGDYDNNTEYVRCEDELQYGENPVMNLHDKEETEKFLFDSGQINFQHYIKSNTTLKI